MGRCSKQRAVPLQTCKPLLTFFVLSARWRTDEQFLSTFVGFRLHIDFTWISAQQLNVARSCCSLLFQQIACQFCFKTVVEGRRRMTWRRCAPRAWWLPRWRHSCGAQGSWWTDQAWSTKYNQVNKTSKGLEEMKTTADYGWDMQRWNFDWQVKPRRKTCHPIDYVSTFAEKVSKSKRPQESQEFSQFGRRTCTSCRPVLPWGFNGVLRNKP